MCLGVPKIMLSLSDLPEGITELRKTVILVMVVTGKGYRYQSAIKIALKGRVQETTGLNIQFGVCQ